MGKRTRGGAGFGAVALAVVLLASGCSDISGPSAPGATFARAASTTTLVPETPLQGVTEGGTGSTTSSTVASGVVMDLSVAVVFPDISRIDPKLSLRALASGDLDRLDSRFREDERVDVFLEQVDARGVYNADSLVAVSLGVAVRPGIAGTRWLCERFGVERETCWRGIRSGDLRAIDCAAPGEKRRCWRIPADALLAFETARSNRAVPKPSRRRRRTTDVIRYF